MRLAPRRTRPIRRVPVYSEDPQLWHEVVVVLPWSAPPPTIQLYFTGPNPRTYNRRNPTRRHVNRVIIVTNRTRGLRFHFQFNLPTIDWFDTFAFPPPSPGRAIPRELRHPELLTVIVPVSASYTEYNPDPYDRAAGLYSAIQIDPNELVIPLVALAA